MAHPNLPPEDHKDPAGGKSRAGTDEWGRYAGFGVQFAIIIGLFAFAGKQLDDWLGTEPFLLLLLVFLGFIGATISLVKQLPVSDRPSKPRP